MPKGLTKELQKKLVGIEACIWSDQILQHKELQPRTVSENYVQYLALPRLAALSEVAWTEKSNRNFSAFKGRLGSLIKLYDKEGYNYRLPVPDVAKMNKSGKIYCKISTFVPGAKLFYEISGTQPTTSSPLYKGAFEVKKGDLIKTFLMTKSGKKSLVTEYKVK
jgi:hexosaminidase